MTQQKKDEPENNIKGNHYFKLPLFAILVSVFSNHLAKYIKGIYEIVCLKLMR
jgi:hypothetical protein